MNAALENILTRRESGGRRTKPPPANVPYIESLKEFVSTWAHK